jgi:GNAT superfamily N-acetyltransferase
MSTEPGPLLARHDAAGAHAMLDSLVCVYAEVYAHKADDPFFTVERFTERLLAHSSRDGYELITASVEGTLIGYAYGVPLPADTGWWRGLKEQVSGELIGETGDRTFALNEIMVRANWRRRGIARQLHDALMQARPEERATLLVEPRNIPARSAYERWGWRQLGTLQPFPDAPAYDAMVLDLRARRSAAS